MVCELLLMVFIHFYIVYSFLPIFFQGLGDFCISPDVYIAHYASTENIDKG